MSKREEAGRQVGLLTSINCGAAAERPSGAQNCGGGIEQTAKRVNVSPVSPSSL